jgi:cell division protease FtsH
MPEWNMEKYRFYVDLPGDFWESGVLLDYLKERQVKVEWDPDSRQYVMPWRNFTRLGEVRTEVQVLDPQESWAFMSWLLKDSRMEFVEKTAALCLAIRGLAILTNIISATSLVRFIKKKTKKKNKREDFWQRMTRAP